MSPMNPKTSPRIKNMDGRAIESIGWKFATNAETATAKNIADTKDLMHIAKIEPFLSLKIQNAIRAKPPKPKNM